MLIDYLYVSLQSERFLENPVYAPATTKTTRSQAVARIANRTASQHLWGSRDVIGHVTI